MSSTTKSPLTVKAAVEFVMNTRRGRAFPRCSWKEITADITEALRLGGFAFTADERGITGLVTGIPYPERKILFIRNWITNDRCNKALFIAEFRRRFPGWKLEAQRRGKMVVYEDTEKFLTRLVNYGK